MKRQTKKWIEKASELLGDEGYIDEADLIVAVLVALDTKLPTCVARPHRDYTREYIHTCRHDGDWYHCRCQRCGASYREHERVGE
jgi:hypothetical protein